MYLSATFQNFENSVGHFPSLGKMCRPLSVPKIFGKLPALSVGQLKVPRIMQGITCSSNDSYTWVIEVGQVGWLVAVTPKHPPTQNGKQGLVDSDHAVSIETVRQLWPHHKGLGLTLVNLSWWEDVPHFIVATWNTLSHVAYHALIGTEKTVRWAILALFIFRGCQHKLVVNLSFCSALILIQCEVYWSVWTLKTCPFYLMWISHKGLPESFIKKQILMKALNWRSVSMVLCRCRRKLVSLIRGPI